MKKAKNEEITENKFSKKQIVSSNTFIDNKDLLNAILQEDKTYSKGEVYEMIENYKKGKVM